MRILQGIILALVLIRLLFFLLVNLLGYTESNLLTPIKSNDTSPLVDQTSWVEEPLILFLTKWNKKNVWDFNWMEGNQTSLHSTDGCPYRCRLTFNQDKYKDTADLVIMETYYYYHLRLSMPRQRIAENQKNTGQIWVALTRESPIYLEKGGIEVDDMFHWIATYRREVDIFWPSATYTNRTLPLKASHNTPKENKSKNKKKLAAWLVSHCSTQSQREVLVRNLQRYIPVDVYGKCGEPCPEGLDCRAYVAQNYKFYLAFENSLCTDYVTEKLFYMLGQNEPIVPVTYSWINDTTLAPPNSYIDARDFKSMQELADYLQYLDKNDDAYNGYLKWRKDFEIVLGAHGNKLCQACEMLVNCKGKLAQGGERLKPQRSILGRHNSIGNGGNFSYFKVAGNLIQTTNVCFSPFENEASKNWLVGAKN